MEEESPEAATAEAPIEETPAEETPMPAKPVAAKAEPAAGGAAGSMKDRFKSIDEIAGYCRQVDAR